MSDFVILTVSNQDYISYLTKMLKSLWSHHTDQTGYALLVNVTDDSKQQIIDVHPNVKILEEDIQFDSMEDEKGFLVCCRTWYIKRLMEDLQTSVFYCDADVIFLEDVSPFFAWLDNLDFSARAKKLKPKVTVNAGILWCKYSLENLQRIDFWIERTKHRGIKWMSDQLSFNDMINKYRSEIKFDRFPKKYNGMSNNKSSKIRHYKGSKKHKDR